MTSSVSSAVAIFSRQVSTTDVSGSVVDIQRLVVVMNDEDFTPDDDLCGSKAARCWNVAAADVKEGGGVASGEDPRMSEPMLQIPLLQFEAATPRLPNPTEDWTVNDLTKANMRNGGSREMARVFMVVEWRKQGGKMMT